MEEPDRGFGSQASVRLVALKAAVEEASMIGKTIRIRGDITGDEDVLVDGHLEGKIELSKALIIGRNAEVKADVQAASVTIEGKFQVTIQAKTRVEIDTYPTKIRDADTSFSSYLTVQAEVPDSKMQPTPCR